MIWIRGKSLTFLSVFFLNSFQDLSENFVSAQKLHETQVRLFSFCQWVNNSSSRKFLESTISFFSWLSCCLSVYIFVSVRRSSTLNQIFIHSLKEHKKFYSICSVLFYSILCYLMLSILSHNPRVRLSTNVSSLVYIGCAQIRIHLQDLLRSCACEFPEVPLRVGRSWGWWYVSGRL